MGLRQIRSPDSSQITKQEKVEVSFISPFSSSKILSIFNVPLLLLKVGSLLCSEASLSSSFWYSVLAQLLKTLRHYSSHLPFLAFPVFSFQLTSSQKRTNVLRSSWPFERLLYLSPSLNLSLLPLPHHPLLPSSLCNLVSAPTSLWKLLFWFLKQHPHHQIECVYGPKEAPRKERLPHQDYVGSWEKTRLVEEYISWLIQLTTMPYAQWSWHDPIGSTNKSHLSVAPPIHPLY